MDACSIDVDAEQDSIFFNSNCKRLFTAADMCMSMCVHAYFCNLPKNPMNKDKGKGEDEDEDEDERNRV